MNPLDAEPVPVTRTVDFGVAKLLPDLDRPRAWLLTVDGAPQSYVDLDDPGHLEFEYVRRMSYVIRAAFATADPQEPDTQEPGAHAPEGPREPGSRDPEPPAAEPLDAVHLGGGALTLPRWLAAARPGARQDVIEADGELAALVAEFLPLRDDSVRDDGVRSVRAHGVRDHAVTVHTADARRWLSAAATGSADLVVADVFGGARVPAHLTSVEFVREVRRVLRGGGIYLANVADAAPFGFLGGQLATVRAAFGADAEMCVLAEPGVLRGRRFGNAIVVATDRPLPLDALARLSAADAFPARVVHGPALTRLTGRARPVRDDTATASPVPPEGAFSVG
ncbi:spermidine synthase [Streptomyces sp. CA-111067]|uniref:spermidine synthase n=1 Tax=Streptomyces sp. CA-111067 TaxID=3240046 RepID=UPI003D962532